MEVHDEGHTINSFTFPTHTRKEKAKQRKQQQQQKVQLFNYLDEG